METFGGIICLAVAAAIGVWTLLLEESSDWSKRLSYNDAKTSMAIMGFLGLMGFSLLIAR